GLIACGVATLYNCFNSSIDSSLTHNSFPTRRSSDLQAILREYARLAPGYDRRWSSYIQAGVRGTLARLGARPTGPVLDVGCGTGALLAALAQSEPPLGGWLAGLDPSPEMLALARPKLAPRVGLRVGRAEEPGCGNAT